MKMTVGVEGDGKSCGCARSSKAAELPKFGSGLPWENFRSEHLLTDIARIFPGSWSS